MSNHWRNLPKDTNQYFGFVYMIIHRDNGKYYIGKKFFKHKKTRPPLKGRKNKRHYTVESDWKTYWGSSPKLLADVEKYGEDAFDRVFLKGCLTKWDCAYDELRYQLHFNVLFDDKSYNEIINVRLRKRK